MVKLLDGEIDKLVLDAKPIRAHFEALHGQVPESLEDSLTPAAYREGYRFQILKVQRRLADREAQDKISKDRERCLADAVSIENQISVPNRSQARIEKQKTNCNSDAKL